MAKSPHSRFAKLLNYVQNEFSPEAGGIVTGDDPSFSFVVDLDGRKYRIRCGPLTPRQLSQLPRAKEFVPGRDDAVEGS